MFVPVTGVQPFALPVWIIEFQSPPLSLFAEVVKRCLVNGTNEKEYRERGDV